MRLLLLLLLCFPALAQTGRITGVVRDKATTEPIPFAAIKVLQDSTIKATTTTDANGHFRTPLLPPGAYDLQTTYIGYKSVKVRKVQVLADSNTLVSIAIKESGEVIECDFYPVSVIPSPVAPATQGGSFGGQTRGMRGIPSTGRVFTSDDIRHLPISRGH